MQDIKTVLADPDFQKLGDEDKRSVLSQLDADFAKLTPDDQVGILRELGAEIKPPEQEAGYIEQTLGRLKEQYFPNRTVGLPEAMGLEQLKRQYTETLPQSKTLSEGLFNLVPFAGPSANQAMASWGQGRPAEAAAILTTDILQPVALHTATSGMGARPQGLAGSLKESAVNQYQKVLNPTKEIWKGMAAKAIPELIDREQVFNSFRGLLKTAHENAENAGVAVQQAYAMLPDDAKSNIKPIWEWLENHRKMHAMVKGTDVVMSKVLNQKIRELQTQLLDLVGDEAAKDWVADPRIKSIKVDTAKLVDMKRILQEAVSKGGGFTKFKTIRDNTILNAQKVAERYIRKELDKEYPDIQKINHDFHFWKTVADVGDATAQRRVGQKGPVVTRIKEGVLSLGAQMAGSQAYGTEAGLAAGAATFALQELLQSTAWRTRSAVIKNAVAEALSKGDTGKAFAIASRAIGMGAGPASVPLRPTTEYDWNPQLGLIPVEQEK